MQTSYSHIAQSVRITIQNLLVLKLNCRAIALHLDLHHSFVCREVVQAKARPTDLSAVHQAGLVQAGSGARRKSADPSRRKLGADLATPLRRTVLHGLRCHWSPEQISGKPFRMEKGAPLLNPPCSDRPVSISHVTICCAIYCAMDAMPRAFLRAELIGQLRKSHKTCMPPHGAPPALMGCPT